ncbi:MAG: hypothetical protein MUC41_06165 [Syntrophobacteraceae bacterium]|jgi:hypothetical protein|nr:hypothetical protein [Syntrophobacteraceae bacterium]
MKIGSCGGGEQIALESSKTKGASAAFGKEFKEILEGEMTGAQSPAGGDPPPPKKTEGAGAVSHLLPLNSADFGGQGPLSLPDVDRLERALGEVGARLESGTVALGQIEESLKSLAAESERLASLVEGFPAGHPLAQLGQELSVLSHVESIKWSRGDYV